MFKRHMIRWQLSLLFLNLLTVAACASPASTLAPDAPRAAARAVAVTPIRRIAAALVGPFQLYASAQVVLQVLHDSSGAPLIEQRGLDARGAQLVVRTTAKGVIRSISRDGVPLGTSSLSRAALLSTALRQLNALGIATPASAPAITDVGGRRIVLWERRVATALVPGDGLRMILATDGAFVGLAQPAPLPLAATPSANSRASAAQAIRAAARIAPADAILGDASLRWVAPGKSGGDEPLSEPLRLVWNIAGTLASGTPFALHLDVVSLQLVGWDWAA
jgi:hypothetical protein